MDKTMVENIKKNMQSKNTEELQQLWKNNDRNEYSDEAFEAIRQILEERDNDPNSIPQQNQPEIYEGQSEVIESKYPALITISGIYKFLAFLVGISSFIGLIYGISLMSEYGGGTLIIIYSLIAGLLVVIFLLAISEGIKLFISIEKNTSNQNKLLDKLIDKIK